MSTHFLMLGFILYAAEAPWCWTSIFLIPVSTCYSSLEFYWNPILICYITSEERMVQRIHKSEQTSLGLSCSECYYLLKMTPVLIMDWSSNLSSSIIILPLFPVVDLVTIWWVNKMLSWLLFYYSLRFNLFVWFWLDSEFKKVRKTFESCSLK